MGDDATAEAQAVVPVLPKLPIRRSSTTAPLEVKKKEPKQGKQIAAN